MFLPSFRCAVCCSFPSLVYALYASRFSGGICHKIVIVSNFLSPHAPPPPPPSIRPYGIVWWAQDRGLVVVFLIMLWCCFSFPLLSFSIHHGHGYVRDKLEPPRIRQMKMVVNGSYREISIFCGEIWEVKDLIHLLGGGFRAHRCGDESLSSGGRWFPCRHWYTITITPAKRFAWHLWLCGLD